MLGEQPRADETPMGVQQALYARVWEYDGVEVRNSTFGFGLFATRGFLPGEVIYSTGWLTLKGPEGGLPRADDCRWTDHDR